MDKVLTLQFYCKGLHNFVFTCPCELAIEDDDDSLWALPAEAELPRLLLEGILKINV